MKKELRRIKTNYSLEVLDIVNNLEGKEWENVPFSIKIEKLLLIALTYAPYWDKDNVFEAIKSEESN